MLKTKIFLFNFFSPCIFNLAQGVWCFSATYNFLCQLRYCIAASTTVKETLSSPFQRFFLVFGMFFNISHAVHMQQNIAIFTAILSFFSLALLSFFPSIIFGNGAETNTPFTDNPAYNSLDVSRNAESSKNSIWFLQCKWSSEMHSVSHPNNGYLLAASHQQNNLLRCVLVLDTSRPERWARPSSPGLASLNSG